MAAGAAAAQHLRGEARGIFNMAGFTKLDEGILQSSVMAAPPVTFKVWIALLAACRSDSVARVSPTYLGAVCRLSLSDVGRALEELAGPDPHSRTTTEEGRRIARVDGGWRLINYFRYRDFGIRQAESQARAERRKRRKGAVRTGPGQNPDLSASASVSLSLSTTRHPDPDSVSVRAREGGLGGEFYRPATAVTPSAAAAAEAAWERLGEALRPRLSPEAWATWLRPCRGVWLREGRLQLEVPGAQHLDWIGRTWSAELQWAAAQSGLEGVDLVMPPRSKREATGGAA